MFDPQARAATGLSGDAYSFVMRHYSALREAHMQQVASAYKPSAAVKALRKTRGNR